MSLREARAIAQPPEYSPSPTDGLYRRFSIFLSLPLARVGATPNGITLAWIAIGLAGVGLLLAESWPLRVVGALLLQLSYLLDFVDGEVARLSDRRSLVGGFVDLMGHGLTKTALPLAMGAASAAATGRTVYLLAGAVAASAIVTGDSLRFYAACTSGRLDAGDLAHEAPVRIGRRTPRRIVLGLFDLSFETPGLYALAVVGAVLNGLHVVTAYLALGAPIWMASRALDYCHRLAKER